VGGIEPPKLLILLALENQHEDLYFPFTTILFFSFEVVGLVWNRTRKLVWIIIKKKFENFKNSNNKIMIILFFFVLHCIPLSRPTIKSLFC
jgi:hypothetical protein